VEAGFSREVLDRMGSALRAFYEAQQDPSETFDIFKKQLAALDRVESVHRKGVDAVKKALEEADSNACSDGNEPAGPTFTLWRPAK